MQDPDLLANEILLAANHPEKMESMTQKARNYFDCHYTFHHTMQELQAWCKAPCHSGDFDHPSVRLDYRWPDQMDLPERKSMLQRLREKLL
jgi:hypothetical protein